MTNNELLHASLLDILFDGRNKDYGAYQLRREYNQRLLLALGLGLSIILLFIFINLLNKNNGYASNQPKVNEQDFNITQLQAEPDKMIQPEKPKPALQKPIEDVATIKNTTIDIVDDIKLKETEVPTTEMIEEGVIGIETKDGKKDDLTVIPVVTTGSTGSTEIIAKPEPVKPSSAPEFPGGFEALKKFLYRYLATPDQLGMNAGEKTMVKARFVVGKDGSISIVEIIESGGNIFDKEVMRVCKKMPKWKPAIQNGEPVSTNYVLPVTFVNEEQ